MPCLDIQASRAGISDSGFDTGRVGLPPANAKRKASAIFDLPNVGKSRCIIADCGQKVRRHQMGMAIDDHSVSLAGVRRGDQIAEFRHVQRQAC